MDDGRRYRLPERRERGGSLFALRRRRTADRKRRLSTGKGIAPISDYHWTAALTAAWLLEEPNAPPATP
jgi:hypothetical protein